MLTAQEIAQYRVMPSVQCAVLLKDKEIDKDEVCEAKTGDADEHHNRLTKCQPNAQLDANLNFNFPQVVRQHTLGAVSYTHLTLPTILRV